MDQIDYWIEFYREHVHSWWADNQLQFPKLARIAQAYLGTQPASLAERLFSGAGKVYDEQRNRLPPGNAVIK